MIALESMMNVVNVMVMVLMKVHVTVLVMYLTVLATVVVQQL